MSYRSRPRLSAVAAYLLLLMALASCPSVQALEPVRIGTGDWVPYVDQGRSDGGALARLVRAIFKAAGYRVEFIYHPWDRNLLMLQHGDLDAVMPYICNAARQRVSSCSEPVIKGEVVLFYRKDRPFNWQVIADLQPYRIATTLGYSYGSQFDEAQQAGRLQVLQSHKEDTGFRLLTLGRTDLHPQDRAVGYAMLRRLFSDQVRATITHHPRHLNTEPLHLLFRKDDARASQLRELFNAGLRRFVENGELERLQQALYSGSPDQWLVEP